MAVKKGSDRLAKMQARMQERQGIRFGEAPIGGYLDSGNLALNALLSGRPDRGYPLGRTTIVSGLQGSGKTYLGSNAAAQALKEEDDPFDAVIIIDTEKAQELNALRRIGVDVDDPRFMIVQANEIEKVQEILAELLKDFGDDDKVLIIVDSLSNAVLTNAIAKNDKGEVAYGQGQKEKVYKQVVQYANGRMGPKWHVLYIAHEYVTGTDMHGNPQTAPSVGKGTLFIPSIGISLKQTDLKEGREQIGIKVKVTTFKSRFVKKGTTIEFELPFTTGMDRYDGYADVLTAAGVIDKNGGWFSYVFDGETYKFQGKGIKEHTDRLNQLFADHVGEVQEMDEDESDKQVNELLEEVEESKKKPLGKQKLSGLDKK